MKCKSWLTCLLVLALLCSSAMAEITYVVDNDQVQTDIFRGVYSVNTDECRTGYGPDAYPMEGQLASNDWIGSIPDTVCPNALNAKPLTLYDADAPSYITTKEGFPPERVLENNNETCWQFDADEEDLSQAYILLELGTPCAVNEVQIKNGFWRKAGEYDQYDRNAKPEVVEISFMYTGEQSYKDPITFTIPDDNPFRLPQEQRVPFKMTFDWKMDVEVIKVRVVSYIRGIHEPFKHHIAITELRVNGLPMKQVPANAQSAMAHVVDTRVRTEPTAHSNGVEVKYCTKCGEEFMIRQIPRLSD